MIAQNGLLTDSLLPALRAARRPFPRRPPARGRRSPLRAQRGRAGPEGARGGPRGRRSHRALPADPGPAGAAAALRPRPGPSCSSEGPGGPRVMSPESCICMAAGRAPGNVWDRPEGEARRGGAGARRGAPRGVPGSPRSASPPAPKCPKWPSPAPGAPGRESPQAPKSGVCKVSRLSVAPKGLGELAASPLLGRSHRWRPRGLLLLFLVLDICIFFPHSLYQTSNFYFFICFF